MKHDTFWKVVLYLLFIHLYFML